MLRLTRTMHVQAQLEQELERANASTAEAAGSRQQLQQQATEVQEAQAAAAALQREVESARSELAEAERARDEQKRTIQELEQSVAEETEKPAASSPEPQSGGVSTHDGPVLPVPIPA